MSYSAAAALNFAGASAPLKEGLFYKLDVAGPDGLYTQVHTLADVPAPSDSLAFVEHPFVASGTNWAQNPVVHIPFEQQIYNNPNGEAWYNASGVTEAQKPSNAPLHNGGWNYAFADGHAKWFRPSQTSNAAPADFYVFYAHNNKYWTIDPND